MSIPCEPAGMSMDRSRAIGLFVLVVSLFTGAGPALGSGFDIELPDGDVATGPAVAYTLGPEHGLSFNWDTSCAYGYFAGSLNLRLSHFPKSGSTQWGPQAEFTLWYLFNLGLGGGWMFGDRAGPVAHVFVGLPVAEDFDGLRLGPLESHFVEPYLRVNLLFPGGEPQPNLEVGVYFKLTTYSY